MGNICYGCMKHKGGLPVCEHCGHDERIHNKKHQLQEGTLVGGQYVLGKVLGQGGFGITYIAWDKIMRTNVAVKEYYPSGYVIRDSSLSRKVHFDAGDNGKAFLNGKKRFLREAESMAKLWDVPQIVKVLRYFEENNTAYIVMEYLEGDDLRNYMRKLDRPMHLPEVMAVLKPVMEALSVAHAKGLVHRDISPDNIMLLPDGSAKLLDFGAVRWVENPDAQKSLDMSTQPILKMGFAPPEQYRTRGSLGPWTDVYALCATIYYCLTGRIPPEAMERTLGKAKLNWNGVSGLTRRQQMALEKGMALEPKNRFQSVKALQGELTASSLRGWKKYLLIGAAAAVLVGAIGYAAVQLGQNREEAPPGSSQSQPSLPSEKDTLPVFTLPRDKKDADLIPSSLPTEEDSTDMGTEPTYETPYEEPPKEPYDPESEPEMPTGRDSMEEDHTPGVNGWNVLASNPNKTYENGSFENDFVFHTDVKRSQIVTIIFLNSLQDAPNYAVDASDMGNGSVKAWTVANGKGYDLYIAANGEIYAPKDSAYLFACMTSLKEIKGSIVTDHVTDMGFMFWYCTNITYLDLSSFCTENVTNMERMFMRCYALTSLNISSFDTGKVTNMRAMFNCCQDLPRLDVSSFDTANVTDMAYMFAVCSQLTELNLSSFKTDKVTDMSYMFCNSKKLTYVDLGSANTSNVRTMTRMFDNCANLKVDIGTFDFRKVPRSDFDALFMPESGMINGRYWKSWVF